LESGPLGAPAALQVTLQTQGDSLAVQVRRTTKEETRIGCRMVRIAESTPDFGQVITSSGRYVTHGIYFDNDRDRLTPESAGVTRLVAAGIEKNPNLKLRIEGHTDSTGKADHNLDLSKRARRGGEGGAGVAFGIEDARLTTDGLSSTKPIDSNDTPNGRAQNRRVEFVKQ
jgi:OOP family OmpA-OmpF porin